MLKCREGDTQAYRERLYIMDQSNSELKGPETSIATSFMERKDLTLREGCRDLIEATELTQDSQWSIGRETYKHEGRKKDWRV